MSAEEDRIPYWQRASERASRIGFSGFDLIPHELIAALGIVRRAAAVAHSKGREHSLCIGLNEIIEGSSHFPLSLWQCGDGELFDETLSSLAAHGSDAKAKSLVKIFPWEKAVPLSLTFALCKALSKQLGPKWQILRLTLETKAALSRGPLHEIFSKYCAQNEKVWQQIYRAALPLYTIDADWIDAFAARFIRDVRGEMGIEFSMGKREGSLSDHLRALALSLSHAAEVLAQMGAEIQELQKRDWLSGKSESQEHMARLLAISAEISGSFHAAECGLIVAGGSLYVSSGAALLKGTLLLAESAYIFADRWLMPLAIKDN